MSASFLSLHERDQIETILRRNTAVNLYGIGDLDEFFWPRTVWYALEAEDPSVVALLYVGADIPVLLLLEDSTESRELLVAVVDVLPARFYAHLHPRLVATLERSYRFASNGLHHKMALVSPEAVHAVDTAQAEALDPADLVAARQLYRDSYPGNWFDPRMLETGQYVGIRRGGRLVSIAGIHVYSPNYAVAALGNITTLPTLRGQGLGSLVTAACCQTLLRTVEVVGLNVKADNKLAIRCYRRLGFAHVSDYVEGMATR